MEKHYDRFAKVATTRISFRDSAITMDIPVDGLVTKDGWTITPFSHPTVSENGPPTFMVRDCYTAITIINLPSQ